MHKTFLATVLIYAICASKVLALQTQINEVTDLFDKHIENKDALLSDMKKQTDSAIDHIKSGQHHDAIIGIGDSAAKANEINSICESDLENAGRQKRSSKEYQFYDENELEPDYTKPGNRMHKLDSDDIVSATSSTMHKLGIDLMQRLVELGFNCKTVKGAIHKDPTYYIEVKRQEKKNTEYDQFFCEELRNKYSCTDSITLKCMRTAPVYSAWQARDILIDGRVMYDYYRHWMDRIFWKDSRRGMHMRNTLDVRLGMRQVIADKLGVPVEQIGNEVRVNPRGEGQIVHIALPYDHVWLWFRFGYDFRKPTGVRCLQWSEDWTERCTLQ